MNHRKKQMQHNACQEYKKNKVKDCVKYFGIRSSQNLVTTLKTSQLGC